MKNKRLSFAALSSLLAALFFVAVAPLWAQSVDERIKGLEQELLRLKTEQIELKKEATAAAAAVPTFSYRPGSGARIEAADRSWSVTLSHETHFRMPFQAGRDEASRTNGQVEGRRFRQEWTLCLNNCFYEIQSRLDLDGFGNQTDLQRGNVWLHFENFNPWLPTFYFGMDQPSRISNYRQGSSATGAQAEYDLLSRNNALNTGRMGTGIGINWDDKPLTALGIPGRISQFNWAMGSFGEADNGAVVNTDRKDFLVFMEIEPFRATKNFWIEGFAFSMNYWRCNSDTRATDNACGSLRIRDHGPGGRQELFRNDGLGKGGADWLMPSVGWRIGPYTLRAVGGFWNFEDRGNEFAANREANTFLIGNDIWLWSPKGLFTGSATTPGSVLFGFHFERLNVSCKGELGAPFLDSTFVGLVSTGNCQGYQRRGDVTGIGSTTGDDFIGQGFKRNRILLREWYLGYVIAPRANVGIHVLWYDAANVGYADAPVGATTSAGTTTVGLRSVGTNLGCRRPAASFTASLTRIGQGCDWVDVLLDFRWSF